MPRHWRRQRHVIAHGMAAIYSAPTRHIFRQKIQQESLESHKKLTLTDSQTVCGLKDGPPTRKKRSRQQTLVKRAPRGGERGRDETSRAEKSANWGTPQIDRAKSLWKIQSPATTALIYHKIQNFTAVITVHEYELCRAPKPYDYTLLRRIHIHPLST